MFYDLNIPWTSASDPQLIRTLHFAYELGYGTVALNHSITGKLPADLKSPITLPPTSTLPPNLQLLTRITLSLAETSPPPSNARLAELCKTYDLLALRPLDEKSLSLASTSLDCEIISLDLTKRPNFWIRGAMLKEALTAGKKIEICYAGAVCDSSSSLAGGAQEGRRAVIANATQILRATRGGRGVILSSEARVGVLGLRAPADVVNLAAVWGLKPERGVEALGREARSAVVAARLKRTGFRGVVRILRMGSGSGSGSGMKKDEDKGEERGVSVASKGKSAAGVKRKGDEMEEAGIVDSSGGDGAAKPVSKRQMKRLQREARARAADSEVKAGSPGAAEVQTSHS